MKGSFEGSVHVGGLKLLAKQLVEGFITGLHKSPYHGFSVEFAEHRLYNPGQSTRHIDWRVFARTDRLFTKQYEEETNLRCLLVLDCSPSMYYPRPDLTKIKFSVYTAAALAYLMHKQRDAVGIALFNNRIEELTSIKSSAPHLNKLFTLLENRLFKTPQKQQNTQTQTVQVLHEIAKKIHRRSLVILFTDMFDSGDDLEAIFKALQHLKHNKHEIILFHVTDHNTELHFNFMEKPYQFIDLESSEKVKLNPSEIKDEYEKKLTTWHRLLKFKCHQLKLDIVPVNALTSYSDVLQTYLVKRQKMR